MISKKHLSLLICFGKSGIEGSFKQEWMMIRSSGKHSRLVTLATNRYPSPEEAVESFGWRCACKRSRTQWWKVPSGKTYDVHAAKGLEFRMYRNRSWARLISHRRMGAGPQSKEDRRKNEDFLRCYYTRKKETLSFVCFVRTIFGQRQVNAPSEFLCDIDDAHTEHEYQKVMMVHRTYRL